MGSCFGCNLVTLLLLLNFHKDDHIYRPHLNVALSGSSCKCRDLLGVITS